MTNRFMKMSRPDLLYLFVLVTAGLQTVNFFWGAANSIGLLVVARKEVPSLVQLTDGKVVAVSAMGSRERTSAAIRTFTGDVLTLMFNMTGELPTSNSSASSINSQRDPGVMLNDTQDRITTASWQASFALASEFRSEMLRYIAKLTPKTVFEGRRRVVLVTRYIGEPEQIRSGVWKVQYIGELLTFSSIDEFGKAAPFNKDVYLRVVDPPRTPLQQGATELEKTVYALRQAGLEMYALREFERKNL